jgi:hypothetical protein
MPGTSAVRHSSSEQMVAQRSSSRVVRLARISPIHGTAACLGALCGLLCFATPALSQFPGEDQPLLPDAVSEQDIELRGRYARQWKQDDSTLIVVYTGAFRLNSGKRLLTADNAVVWIVPRHSEPEARRYFDLTVYLQGAAEVHEPAGTITEDAVLLVSNLRTYGRVVKYDDAHSPENMETSEFYQQALADRRRIEEGLTTRPADVEVQRPLEVSRTRPQPKLIRYALPKGTEPATTRDGEPVQVATGRVYFAQSGSVNAPVLEIQADSAVIFPAERTAISILGDEAGIERPTAPAASSGSAEPGATSRSADEGSPRNLGGFVRAVYLEGDVILTLGDRVVRASRLYYDFERERALILDGVFRVDVPERSVPMYVRAAEVRQLSQREFSAANARVSTSEFFTPHYHIGAEKIYIRDLTERDARGQSSGPLAGSYEMRNATLNVENTPILWWPYSQGNLEESETLLRRFRTGWSDDYGFEVETAWYLFNLLGVRAPPGVDATLKLDYFSEKGPGIGIDGRYQQEDYFGYTKNYFIYDQGEDDFGSLRDTTPDTETRGRTLWRHRHYLPNDWELTLEVAYVSDPGFLEQYEKNEWFEQKQQETVLYLKRAQETDAVTLLANWRLLDFVTQTEHLPEATYRRIGDVLDPLVFYHESRVGAVRHRRSDPDLREEIYNWQNDYYPDSLDRHTRTTDMTFRADAREEAEIPFKLPGVNIVPFSSVRGSFWDGQPLDTGSLWRGLGVYGIRGSAYLAKVFDDVESEIFDLNKIRHIVQPDYAFWWANSNTRSDNITPFDEGVETIDAVYGGYIGLRQTWQTKRGAAEKLRSADVFALNLELGFFGGDEADEDNSNGWVDPMRPEESRARNYFGGEAIWRLSDTTTLLYDFNLDLNDGEFDRNNVSLAVERTPRLAYVFGYRHADDIELDYVGGGFNYRLNEKHITAMRAWYDTDRGRLGEATISYIRKLPRWYLGVNVTWDEVFDDLSVSVSLWPEGIPEWTLGSRRFSQLGQSTSIKPTPVRGTPSLAPNSELPR